MSETGNYKLELDEAERVIKAKLKTTREQKMSQSQMQAEPLARRVENVWEKTAEYHRAFTPR